ncbi:MAG TPA: site-2 protease family protein [Patescibacteria group bacterium]|nr:site-2 protease family protein [Patescibacteria group bacterium]
MYLLGQPPSQIFAFALTAILAFAYHEYAHAIVADRLGDPTPRSYGRMSPNPIRHLNAFGLIMLFLVGFGWATTPVNPNLLKGNPRKSMMIVALAGPLANLLMATLFAIPIRLGVFDPSFSEELLPTAFQICWTGVQINLLLFAFNLLPVPPLDGFTILLGILPADLAYQLAGLRQYGNMILLGLLILPQFTGTSIIGLVITPVMDTITLLLTGIG